MGKSGIAKEYDNLKVTLNGACDAAARNFRPVLIDVARRNAMVSIFKKL
jgi:hypothetical protein